MSYLQQAFNTVLKNAKPSETWYVTLMEESQFYGGPQEGGWWGYDSRIVASQEFPSEKEARSAAEAVEKFATELDAEARKSFGKQCLRETAWLEARGLDDDFLPEVDGPDKYEVIVSQGMPKEHQGNRHWE